MLARVLGRGDAVLKPVHFIEGAPEAMVENVQELGLEGVVAKYTGAPYQGGRTSLVAEARHAPAGEGVAPPRGATTWRTR